MSKRSPSEVNFGGFVSCCHAPSRLGARLLPSPLRRPVDDWRSLRRRGQRAVVQGVRGERAAAAAGGGGADERHIASSWLSSRELALAAQLPFSHRSRRPTDVEARDRAAVATRTTIVSRRTAQIMSSDGRNGRISPSPTSASPRNRKQSVLESAQVMHPHLARMRRYGAIRFPASKHPPAKWACVGPTARPSDLRDLILQTWRVPEPSVLISVTGAAAGVSIPPKLEQVFRRGLRKAALTTKAWIVTGGTKSGVMELVGKTVREADVQVPCIGIAPWGAVKGFESLEAKHAKVANYDRVLGLAGGGEAAPPTVASFVSTRTTRTLFCTTTARAARRRTTRRSSAARTSRRACATTAATSTRSTTPASPSRPPGGWSRPPVGSRRRRSASPPYRARAPCRSAWRRRGRGRRARTSRRRTRTRTQSHESPPLVRDTSYLAPELTYAGDPRGNDLPTPALNRGRSRSGVRIASRPIAASSVASSMMEETRPLPMVLVVLGGGLGTLKTVEGCIASKKPVAVLPESHRRGGGDRGGVRGGARHVWAGAAQRRAHLRDVAEIGAARSITAFGHRRRAPAVGVAASLGVGEGGGREQGADALLLLPGGRRREPGERSGRAHHEGHPLGLRLDDAGGQPGGAVGRPRRRVASSSRRAKRPTPTGSRAPSRPPSRCATRRSSRSCSGTMPTRAASRSIRSSGRRASATRRPTATTCATPSKLRSGRRSERRARNGLLSARKSARRNSSPPPPRRGSATSAVTGEHSPTKQRMAQHYKTNQVVPAADDGSAYPTPCMRPTAKRATFANGGVCAHARRIG